MIGSLASKFIVNSILELHQYQLPNYKKKKKKNEKVFFSLCVKVYVDI